MFLKKIISRLLFPLPLGIELLVAGLLIWSFTRRRKFGQALVVAGTAWMTAIGYPFLPRLLLPGLLQQYPPLAAARLQDIHPRFIVVPGMGISNETRYPANLRFPTAFLLRLIEAVRLYRSSPGSRILVSISNTEMSPEEKMRALSELMQLFGVDPGVATVVTGRFDTEEEITGFLAITGAEQVYLVDSAAALPRAMILARRYHLNAVPSPSSPGGLPPDPKLPTSFNIVDLFPDSENVGGTELAFYERLGLMYEQLKGHIK